MRHWLLADEISMTFARVMDYPGLDEHGSLYATRERVSTATLPERDVKSGG